MTWYGKNTKQLDQLLESRPSLQQLLSLGDFFQEIKSYNPKLLDYFSTNPSLIAEAIRYLTQSPLPSDSQERKYRLPQQAIELVETQTTCVLNSFFKEEKGTTNFDLLFRMLDGDEVLPLLAGYFFRANLSLLNNKYKETVDQIYGQLRFFEGLVRHSGNMAISNTIQLYLNLDINKNVVPQPDRLTTKLSILGLIFDRIGLEASRRGPDSGAMVQNLCSVLVETVDKYYLIVDGKQMVEAITSEKNVRLMLKLIGEEGELAFPAFAFFVSLINYYSFSSFNAEDAGSTPETAQKNQERLEKEPLIDGLVGLFAAMERIGRLNKMDLYHYRMLEVLCHCISIASGRILRRIVEVRFFGVLIDLLFKHENNNILHMLIEKSFYHIFISERKIYNQYKRHLFCDLDIIEATTSRVLRAFPESDFLNSALRKPYIGHFMRILKIYSGIQPTDEAIIAAIKAKTVTWNKISDLLIKPYEAVCFKEIGTYDNVPPPSTQDFTITNSASSPSSQPQDRSAIEEINKEEAYPPPRSPVDKKSSQQEELHGYSFDSEPTKLGIVDRISSQEIPPPPQKHETESMPEGKELKKNDSYQEYLLKQKVVAGEDIKNKKRSLSQDRKINTSRGRMTSPSPNKKNSWKDKEQKDEKPSLSSQSMSVKSDQPVIPRAPISRRAAITPAQGERGGERENRFVQESRPVASRSVNMQEVRRIKVIQIDVPKEKKYRRTDEKDKALLQFLGIAL